MGDPRKHHYVPQCWLAGFTENGDKRGRLHVTDFKLHKQWPSSPAQTGHMRDFYRLIESPNLDPLVYEKLFGIVEDAAAPVFKELDQNQREPTRDELDALLVFIAAQWTRTPAFREWVLKTADSIHHKILLNELQSKGRWLKYLKRSGVDIHAPGADYIKMRDFIENHRYTLAAENDWYLYRGIKQLWGIVDSLKKRWWRPFFSTSGNFIANDNPVVMDGPKGTMVGFESADIIVFTLSRHVALYGALRRFRYGDLSRNQIARHNTFTMLNATQQVYSHVSDFCWTDARGTYQTDWQSFSSEDLKVNIPSFDLHMF